MKGDICAGHFTSWRASRLLLDNLIATVPLAFNFAFWSLLIAHCGAKYSLAHTPNSITFPLRGLPMFPLY